MRHLRILAILVAIYSIARFAVIGILRPLANFSGDFLASFPAWKVALLTGRLDLYAGSLAQEWGPPPIWHYGPVQHLITLPLLAFPTLRSAYVAWLFVNMVFLAVTAVIAAKSIDNHFVVFIVFCNFIPLYAALAQRTIEIFELMLIFAAWALYRRGRDTACGLAIGAAAMAKFLPLIVLPWLVLKRRWRALGAALAVIAPLAIATQFVLGWQHSGSSCSFAKEAFSIARRTRAFPARRSASWRGRTPTSRRPL